MPNTSNFSWPTPADTDLVKDGAAAIRDLGDGVDTSLVDLLGGTTGQVLTKASDTDLDFSFTTPSGSPLTTKGDLYTFGTSDTRLGVGADGTILVANSSETTGLEWVAPAGGGKVLQVVYGTTTTQATSSSSTLANTNLTATITPSLATSQVLVMVSQNGCTKFNDTGIELDLFRDAVMIGRMAANGLSTSTALTLQILNYSISVLDTPATTSALIYKTQFGSHSSIASVRVQQSNARSTIILMEIGA